MIKKISIREFQRHASDYMDKLPIILTRYNEPVAKIVDIAEGKEQQNLLVDKKNKKEAVVKSEIEKKASTGGGEEKIWAIGKCDSCQKTTEVRQAIVSFPNGNNTEMDICQKCFNKSGETGLDIDWAIEEK